MWSFSSTWEQSSSVPCSPSWRRGGQPSWRRPGRWGEAHTASIHPPTHPSIYPSIQPASGSPGCAHGVAGVGLCPSPAVATCERGGDAGLTDGEGASHWTVHEHSEETQHGSVTSHYVTSSSSPVLLIHRRSSNCRTIDSSPSVSGCSVKVGASYTGIYNEASKHRSELKYVTMMWLGAIYECSISFLC